MNQFGLIGKSLGHSFSPGYFHKKFSSERIQAQYGAFELEHIEAFPSLLQHVPALKGLNVTIPYKEAVIPYLDELSPEAAEIGAVNTIAIAASGYLKGYNTDVIGFRDSLEAAWAGEPMQQAVVPVREEHRKQYATYSGKSLG
jgi:shikimate dehydrogenase